MSLDSTLSALTYTSVYSDFEPWRFQWVSDAESQSPEAAPQAPLSPNYVLGPEHPVSSDYVPGPEYPKYLDPSDGDIPIKYQPLPADASPTSLSPGYIADSDLEEDSEDDPEEDLADYPADRGDEEEEESFGDDADDEDEEEAFEEEDDDEDEEHLALADSSTVPIDDLVPAAKDTKAFETDESAPIPPPPRLRRARISVRPQTPMAAATKALIVAVAAALPSSSPPPSLTPLSSPLP
ncbi:hypothetical protein Tco_1373772 [Tanacetum coccineum]